MNRYEKLSSSIYDLIEDVAAGRVVVRNKTVTMNSLYLLRDALIDLRYTYLTIERLTEKRNELIEAQVKTQDFGGELHMQYHDVSGQLRAARVAMLQQGKRVLNASSHLLVSLLPHGINIRTGSFGKQYLSALAIDTSKLDKRSKKLLQNLIKSGPKLEVHNDNRDHYVEHSSPATVAEQERPVHDNTGVHYMKRRAGFENQGEEVLSGMVREAMPGYVLMGRPNPKGGKEILAYHIHIAHLIAPVKPGIVRSVFTKRPPVEDPDHFKKLEPHTHQFAHPENGDGSTSGDYGVEITELAGSKQMSRDYCEYIRKLLEVARLS